MNLQRKALSIFSRFSSTGCKERYKVLYPGQGSQYVGMSGDLPPTEGLDKLFATAKSVLGYDVRRLCLEGPAAVLNDTMHCQPAVVLTSLAAWEALKVTQPQIIEKCASMAGFSVGEITALIASDALSLEEGLQLVKTRAEAMHRASHDHPSAMVTVSGLDHTHLNNLINKVLAVSKDHVVSIATYLFPRGFVLAGTKEGIVVFKDLVSKESSANIRDVNVSGGFHSILMSSAIPDMQKALKEIQFQKPRFTIYSNVTGLPYEDPSMIKELLVKQLTRPILWQDIMSNMIEREGESGFIEVGPKNQLKVILKSISREAFKNCISL